VLLVKLHVFFEDNQVEKLFAQALISDHEVYYLNFCCQLWQVVRVAMPTCHIKLKFICVVNVRVAKLNLFYTSNFEDLFE